MDNIDAWMDRALDITSSSDSKKDTIPQKKRKFSDKGKNTKKEVQRRNSIKNPSKKQNYAKGQAPARKQDSTRQQSHTRKQDSARQQSHTRKQDSTRQQSHTRKQDSTRQQSLKKKQYPTKQQSPARKHAPQKKWENKAKVEQKNNHRKNEHSKNDHRKNDRSKKDHQKNEKFKKIPPTPILKGKLKIIPLGGLNEVGKNMLVLEYEDDIIILDMGLEFPDADMMGIDYVIPDVGYLERNKKRIRGIVLTHGHLDHIGGIPYILPKLDFPPVYGTKLTMGLVKRRAEEFKQEKTGKYHVVDPKEKIKLGKFTCSFFRVTHSIPDSVGIVVDTPIGKVVDTGDFKFDNTPVGTQPDAEIEKMKTLGNQNVLALFCEATNALKPGHSMSEKEVQETLERIVKETEDRIIISSFSSQIGRIQQILDAAKKHDRKVFVSGKSMITNIKIAAELGYLHFPKDLVSDIKKYKKTKDRNTLILTTGSQGETISALARIATDEHAHIAIKKGDTIVLSSSPIIGNEKAIQSIVNKLTMRGANVIHNELMDVHTSGHGKQEELIRMVNYIKPKYLIPIHGEFYMRKGLTDITSKKCGIRPENMIMIQNGDILIGENGKIYVSEEKVETKYILIDGSGEGQIGSQVQFDREIMSENGVLVVLIYISKKGKKIIKEPDVISRGFTYLHETEEITKEVIKLAEQAYRTITEKNPGANRSDIKKYIRQTVDKFTNKTLDRRPLIVPLIIEV